MTLIHLLQILEQIRKYRSDKLNKRKLRYYRERSKHLPLDVSYNAALPVAACKEGRILRKVSKRFIPFPIRITMCANN